MLSILTTWILILTKEEVRKEVFEEPILLIETFEVNERDYRIYIESDSETQPKLEYVVTPNVSGEIIYVSDYLDNNLVFKKGELLIQIDSSDYSIARINAKARLDVATLDYKLAEASSARAQEELNAYKYGNATDLANKIPQLKSSKSLLEAAEANYQKALLDLARTTIFAPFNGRVEQKFITTGMKVSNMTSLAKIYSTDIFMLDFPISISDIEYLGIAKNNKGFIEPADLRIDIVSKVGNKNYKYEGIYSGISGSIDKLTQTVNLKVLLDMRSTNLPIDKGIFSEAKIYGKIYNNVCVIPNQAINDKEEVYVVRESVLHRQVVEIVKEYKDSTVVSLGLSQGDIINITPIPVYIDSMRVNILER